MDLPFLEAAAAFSKHAVVFLAAGGVLAGYRAYRFAIQQDERRRLDAQFAVIMLAALGACAGYSVYYFTDAIGRENQKIAEAKEAAFERFKIEKTAEIQSASARLKSSEEKIAGLTAETARANERTRTMGLELEKQRERTARAEKELLEVQERLQPRRLTAAQRTGLREDLSQGPQTEIQIAFVSGNIESETFANDFAEVFHLSGWKIGAMSSTTFIGKGPVGVRLVVQDAHAPAVVSVLSAFEHLGYSVQLKVNPKAQHPLLLIVGHKP